ncbi:MAG TPA: ribosome recycling factor [Flavobacteriales bacterium]|nr:ribosome recycling factor [Flavobacteriales bacterium]
MQEELDFIKDAAKESMDKAIAHLDNELLKIRASKATPSMLDSVYVDYYGATTPLNQVSNINTPDPRTLSIQPWEKQMLEVIERAIINSNLGLNPQNNGEMIMINVPVLTEERRLALVKQAKHEGENAKISIRNARKDANDDIKKLMKEHFSEDLAHDMEVVIQDMTTSYSHRVDEKLAKKEKDIMTV